MTTRLQDYLTAALRLMVAASCCIGIWYSWQLARADYLFRQDTKPSIRQAISMVPDAWPYYMRLAELEPAQTQQLLTTAVRLDSYNAQADIELGLQYEAQGDFGRAEKWLLSAFAVDHTYLPRWSLASFYFRRGNMTAFWTWARSAAAMPSANIGSLFALCWRVSPDPQRITAAIANNNPKFLRQYIEFLQSKNQTDAVAATAFRLVRNDNSAGNTSLLLSVINELLGANDVHDAVTLWHLLIQRHWVVAESTLPYNAAFARQPLPVDFDWRLPGCSGTYSLPGPSGLDTEFSGSEPANCTVAEQTVALAPGKYVFGYTFQTAGILPDTGIRWQIVDAKSNTILASSSDLSSDSLKHAVLTFSVPHDVPLLHLRLIYQREPGQSRISGSLLTQSTQIQAQPSS